MKMDEMNITKNNGRISLKVLQIFSYFTLLIPQLKKGTLNSLSRLPFFYCLSTLFAYFTHGSTGFVDFLLKFLPQKRQFFPLKTRKMHEKRCAMSFLFIDAARKFRKLCAKCEQSK